MRIEPEFAWAWKANASLRYNELRMVAIERQIAMVARVERLVWDQVAPSRLPGRTRANMVRFLKGMDEPALAPGIWTGEWVTGQRVRPKRRRGR